MKAELISQEVAQDFLQRIHSVCNSEGGIKGRILLLRSLLEDLYKTLTQDARISTGNLFSRMQYLHNEVNMPSFLVGQANEMRKLGNKVSHESDFIPKEKDYLSCVWVLVKLLEHFQAAASHPALSKYIQQRQAQAFTVMKSTKKVDFLCVVKSWKLTPSIGIDIDAIDEEGEYVSIRLFDGDEGRGGRNWSLLDKVLWPWVTLNCIKLKEASSGNNRYVSEPGTLIVVEPDYLMDVSTIADCMTYSGMHPELSLINRLIDEPSSSSIVLGSTVNNIFDDLMFEPEAEYDQLFKDSLARAPIPMVALGAQDALDIYNKVKSEHLPRLRQMARYARTHPMMLEPSFICPKYGLQGRLDLLYQKDGKQYITELKSGSVPQGNLWPQHQAQVIGYNMMIRECYGYQQLGSAAVLYSKSPTKSLRLVSNTVIQEQDLLMCRNRILGIWKQLADDPKSFFDWFKTYTGEGLAPFIITKIRAINVALNDLDADEYEWFLQQIRLAVREAWYIKIGSCSADERNQRGHNALWRHSKEEKLQRYKILPDLELQGIDINCITFKIKQKELISNFREGDVVIAYREDLKIYQQQIIRAELIELGKDYIVIRARGLLNPAIIVSEEKHSWAIEHDLLESMLFGPLASIMSLAASDKEKRQKVIGLRDPTFDELELKASDQIGQLIDKIMATKDYCVVQGPPGTGKTSGLVTRLIKELYTTTGQIILVLSFTNRAVDEICSNLDKHDIDYIRTGRSQSVQDKLLENMIQDKKFAEIEQIVKSNRIWVATVHSCNAWIQDFTKIVPHIDTVIIDEASQIIESNILGIISLASRFILVGDQNQLPPIVSQQEAVYNFESPRLQDLHYSSYNRSMMERLFLLCQDRNLDQAKFMLSKQYRMHSEISSLVQHYYNHQLECGTEHQKGELQYQDDWEEYLKHRVVWIDCPPTADAYYDNHQVEVIYRLLQRLKDVGRIQDLENDVGIVAPFRAMIQALKHKLVAPFDVVTIDTVERFQGSERKIILMSLPLRDKYDIRSVESISDDRQVDRKLNVAISRAKEQLYIIGNINICRNSPHYAFLIDTIRSSHKVISSEQIIGHSI